MDKINRMNYADLCELKILVDGRLSVFRKVRIKTKWRRCGKRGCACMDGPADGSQGNLHGPYIFAQYTDGATKKPMLVSLGRHRRWGTIDEDNEKSLDIRRYFKLSQEGRSRLSNEARKEFSYKYTMSDQEYRRAYDQSPGAEWRERPDTFYGDLAGYNAFVSASEELSKKNVAEVHEWAECFGLANYKGQQTLRDILRGPYYLVGL